MERKREIIIFENHFDNFYDTLDERTQEKVDEILFFITILDRIPTKFLKKIKETKDLMEVRVEFESNIYRIFCCFDEGKLIVLFNVFQKKTQKTPKKEIKKALAIRDRYFEQKEINKQENEKKEEKNKESKKKKNENKK